MKFTDRTLSCLRCFVFTTVLLTGLRVELYAQAPIITAQPQSQTVVAGNTVTFSVTATGAASYQWVFNSVGISGATNATLGLTNVTVSQAGSYAVFVFNGSNYVESSAAALTVLPAPAITSSTAVTTYVGGELIYAITASNSPTMFGVEGSLPPGCTFNPTTGIISGSPTLGGTYSVTILADNGNGVGTSMLTITVNSSPPAPTWSSTTLAGPLVGRGGNATGSANGIGISARFYNPAGVTVDGNGIVYVADTGNNTIREITPNGTVTTLAGTAGVTGDLDGTGPAAQFNAPSALVADATGNLYVVDTNNSTIRKITPAGVATTLAGFPGVTGSSDGTGLTARFNQPEGITIDSNGVLYVADTGNGLVREVTTSGVVTTVVTSGSIALNKPFGIAINGAETIFIWDTGRQEILEVAPSGNVSVLANVPRDGPGINQGGIALDSSGNAYILVATFSDTATVYLWQISPTGIVNIIYIWTNSVSAPGGGIAINDEGELFCLEASAVLTVSPEAPPSITIQPQSESIAVGNSGSLSVTASGEPAPTYQWQLNGANIVGATSSTLALSNVSLSAAGSYAVVVTNASEAVTSDPATVTVTPNATGPTIASQPQSESVNIGSPATLSVTATGSADSFQWLKDGIAIAGATGTAYTITDAQAGNDGVYSVMISNAGGIVTSSPIHLGVNIAPGTTYLSNWTSEVGLPTGTQYTSVAFDGARYLAVGSDGSLLVSGNGVSWTASASAPGRLNSLIYAGAPYGFLGVGDNGVILSAAGPAYTPLLQTSGISSLLTGIAVGNGRMVAVGYAGVALSSAFTVPAWAPGITGVSANMNSVAFGNGTFVAVGLGGTVITSPDGLLWTQQNLGASTDLYSVAYGPAGFVAIGNNGSATAVFTSRDGLTWSPQSVPTTNTLIRVIYSNGTFVAVGAPGAIISSTDGGFTWVAGSAGTSSTLEGVAFGTNSFIAVGNNGVVAQSAALLSITTQPQPQTIAAGVTGTFTVLGAGSALSYQWQFNGTPIPGATAGTLTLSNTGTTQAGNYSVVISNAYGSVTSNPATLTTNVSSYLYNISSRAYLGAGPYQNIVAGFYTNGSGSKNVVLGGIGPDLAVIDPALSGLNLTNPKLTLFNGGGTVLATNTAWGGSQTLINALASVYAPPLPTNSNDTVIFTSVPAGPGIGYTAEMDGLNNTTGIALIEAYDYDSYTGTPASNLINISTRAFVGTGNDVLVAGFWTIGSTSQTLLIRAVGPGLAASDPALSGLTLVTPTLTLYDSSGKIIATNTGWGNAPVAGNSTVAAGIQPATTAIMNSVYASSIAAGSTDCAMVVTLPSNAGYTVQVNGVNSTTGVALVEVYNVP